MSFDIKGALEEFRRTCRAWYTAEQFAPMAEAEAKIAAAFESQEKCLEVHRRFHGKTGCPGYPDCYVCAMEADND